MAAMRTLHNKAKGNSCKGNEARAVNGSYENFSQ